MCAETPCIRGALKTALIKTKRWSGFPAPRPHPVSIIRYLLLLSKSDDGCVIERLRSLRAHYISILDGLARE